ncbi:hypothetical protein M2175_001284 [Bradyrhizobium elkanii]|nr:hypothetical protein [Bradyrhizobium elkanii]MCS3966806.1 hypothetical protein [Bradyrhizobium japonicum]
MSHGSDAITSSPKARYDGLAGAGDPGSSPGPSGPAGLSTSVRRNVNSPASPHEKSG